ncbi:hypothetical protein S40285_01655 [Stachybotrys chlorohalonatus IBT 40285]|uniref:Nucleolar protein 16 n=1 Tax=Stachybotrys chlorohalonatus (strain IBT 40285) TaxID=1283841 RepID=A0A084QE10_STAC4|nr:hypothetical protein S40285_01655 [Stachybotrys chlorohalonata IBT 40285]
MGRDLQKKKRRSGRQPVKQNTSAKKVLNPRGNTLIAKNWDKKETLAQNYRRLGLVARLRAPAGGNETVLHSKPRTHTAKDPFGIAPTEKSIISEARVERDATGKIVRVLHGVANPLNDPLAALDTDSEADEADEDTEEWGGIEDGGTEVVRSLVEQSRRPAEKKPRLQSRRECEWLEQLVARHGDDAAAMARDRRLNPMQQTAADLARRIAAMRARQAELLEALLDKYDGDDVQAMAGDRKRNPMEWTAEEIASRIEKLKQSS